MSGASADTPELLARFRQTAEAGELGASIPDLIDRAAARHGDTRLWRFIDSGDEITYRGLAEQTRALAAGLAALGIGRGSHVAVMLPNIPAFPLTWLALARLGAVMVPINTRYTPREVAYVVTDSGASHLVVGTDSLATLDTADETRALLPRDRLVVVGTPPTGCRSWAAAAAGSGALAVPPPALDDLVNIQYTSGTTGFPKGCMLPQRYWLVMSQVAATRVCWDAPKVLAHQPFYYMDPQWLLLMTVRRGGTIFVAAGPSATRYLGWVRDFGIDYAIFPPIVLKQPPSPADADCSLRAVSIYGLTPQLHAELEQRFRVVAREGYGMTEIGSGLSTPFEITDMVGSGSCGAASPFRETTICDAAGNPVADGEIGELWVRGPGIMQGYWNKPEANAEVFRPGGWFRTGDLFLRDARGFHYIVGRIKDMIRRSGENVAAREVEAVALTHPAVQEAAAVGVPDPDRGQEIKMLLVLKPEVDPKGFSLDGFVDHCAAGLAPFKVPRYLALRDSLPKTPTEKIAKHLLVAEGPDLRVGAYDRVDRLWR